MNSEDGKARSGNGEVSSGSRRYALPYVQPRLVLAGGRRIGATENKPLFAAGNQPRAAPARQATCQGPTAPAVSAFGTRRQRGRTPLSWT